MFSCECCEVSKNNYSIIQLLTAGSKSSQKISFNSGIESGIKNLNNSCSDAKKRSFDGAEICRLTGLCILLCLKKDSNKLDIGFSKTKHVEQTDSARKHNIAIASVEASIELVIYLRETDLTDVTTANVTANTYIQY